MALPWWKSKCCQDANTHIKSNSTNKRNNLQTCIYRGVWMILRQLFSQRQINNPSTIHQQRQHNLRALSLDVTTPKKNPKRSGLFRNHALPARLAGQASRGFYMQLSFHGTCSNLEVTSTGKNLMRLIMLRNSYSSRDNRGKLLRFYYVPLAS